MSELSPSRARLGRRLVVAALVLGFWLAMMVALAVRQGAFVPIATLDSTQALVSDQRFGLFAGTERVGDVRLDQRAETRGERSGVTTEITTRLEMVLMERPTDLALDGEIWRADDRSRGELDFTLASNGSVFRLTGMVQDGILEATVDSGADGVGVENTHSRDPGSKHSGPSRLGSNDSTVGLPLRFPVDEELWVESGLGRSLRLPPLEPGEELRVASFDPLTMSRGTSRIRAIGVGSWRLEGAVIEARAVELESAGTVSTAWVDTDGGLLEATTPIGLVLRRDGALPLDPARGDLARGALGSSADAAAPNDLLSLTAVRPHGIQPQRGAETLRLRLRLADSGGSLRRTSDTETPILLPDAFQRTLTGSSRDREEPALSIVTMRPEGSDRRPLAADLAPSPLIESTHPRIVAKAQEIVAALDPSNAESAEARARAIHDWVFTTLAKEPVLSVPSALEVLNTQRGDCNEHATLYTALARAVDLPTRIGVGLVWSESLEGFYYHAWPEVWLGDTWLRADPTLGQWPADATHLKLVEGGIEAWPRLIPFIGRLEITVEPDPAVGDDSENGAVSTDRLR